MQITKKIEVAKEIKTMVCYMVPRFYEDIKMTLDGEPVEVDENGKGLPSEIFDNWIIDTKETFFLNYFKNVNQIKFIIDIDKGVIKNWKQGMVADIYWKVVDQGLYQYYDENDKLFAEYSGYVPDELGITDTSYGDYVCMFVNENGEIQDWDTTKSRIQQTLTAIEEND